MPGWILVPSEPWRWQEKPLCSVTIKVCATLHGQSNVGSMCDSKPFGSLDLSVLVEILSGVDSDHGTGPRRNGSVNIMSNRKKVMLTKRFLQALIWLFTFCKLGNFFLLYLASLKTLWACSILWGCERQIFYVNVSQWSLQQPSCQCHQPQ